MVSGIVSFSLQEARRATANERQKRILDDFIMLLNLFVVDCYCMFTESPVRPGISYSY